jgi:ubiquinone/menaquinone biosynthesis C-methylase UbiE
MSCIGHFKIRAKAVEQEPVNQISNTEMNDIFDFKTAQNYDRWFEGPHNRFVFDLENELMLALLAPRRGERLLDIGCGTGNHLLLFAEMGLDVTGIDSSPYMLDIARKKVGRRAAIRRGVAEDLPFEDNTFDIAVIMNVLEFTEYPARAIGEACRVSKDRIFLGVLNLFAYKAIERRIKGIFTETIYNKARFFSIWGLQREVRSIVGTASVSWRTVHLFPARLRHYTETIERWAPLQRSPFGTFIGMLIKLIPMYQTKNIEVAIDYMKQRKDMAAGIIRDGGL